MTLHGNGCIEDASVEKSDTACVVMPSDFPEKGQTG